MELVPISLLSEHAHLVRKVPEIRHESEVCR